MANLSASHNAPCPFDTAPMFRCKHQCNGVFMKGHECAWRALWQTFLEVIMHPLHAPSCRFDTAPYVQMQASMQCGMKVCGGH